MKRRLLHLSRPKRNTVEEIKKDIDFLTEMETVIHTDPEHLKTMIQDWNRELEENYSAGLIEKMSQTKKQSLAEAVINSKRL